MSLFNKPKRNIRRRSFNDETEDNENRMDAETIQPIKVKPKKKDKPKQTLLSFGEELDEGYFPNYFLLSCKLIAKHCFSLYTLLIYYIMSRIFL